MADTDPKALEQDAYAFLAEEKFSEAFRSFIKAADLYKNEKNHSQAALCYASAASCWALRSGEKAFYNAASSYEAAAQEAETSGDLEYASLLYRYAAINYEKDMEYVNFSECFYKHKESYRRFLTIRLFRPAMIRTIMASKEEEGVGGAIRRFFSWLSLTFSFLVWGHGERPARTLFAGIFLILVSAGFYTQGYLTSGSEVFHPSIFEALYFSVVTFTTVGYGDLTPVGINRLIVMTEVFFGIFIVPLFLVGLSRKYLRI